MSRCLLRLYGLLLVSIFLVAPHAAEAQQVPLSVSVLVPGTTGYSDAIPKPEAIIGHQIGTAHTTPAQIHAYFQAVAAVSDRVLVEEHARSHEGRPLIHALITSPANHARLEDIRRANLRLSDEPDAVSDADLAGMPAVVYMGYSIHGNEASGSEAAVLILYHLAAGQGVAVEDALDEVVVILDPMFNPDGRDRFTDWVNRNRGAVPVTDPQNREHNEPWPGGRTNHYWFDLNRDWLPLAHPESQGRLEVFHRWRPQVLTDHHEMSSNATFFFQPGVPSRTNPNTPARNQELTGEIATYHAAALDRIGQLYYSEEGFDDFYYGKGSTYPDVNGAIGILFEQASSRALERETTNGVLDYATTIRNQFVTSLSTLEAAVAMREKLLQHQRAFYREAEDVIASSLVSGYVISLDRGRTRAQLLAQLLQRHRIRVHDLARDVEVEGTAYRAGEAYFVPMDQPQAQLLKAVMERVTTFQDSLFYDVSTWTLPLAYDVDYAEWRQADAGLAGSLIDEVTLDGGHLAGSTSDYGYLMAWGRYFAPRALYKLQEAGLRAYVMKDAFSALMDGQAQSFPRGTIFIPVDQEQADAATVHALVRRVVEEDHVRIYAVDSGLTPEGPDLGSPSRTALQQPRVALLTGEGASAYNAGETWHLLSERFRMPVSLLDVNQLGGADLDRYNTLVLAGGSYGGLGISEIKKWIQSGGTLIAMTGGADWALQNGFFELTERTINLDSLLKDVPYADLPNSRGAQVIGGTIFEARLDQTHPLAYSMAATIPVFRTRNTFYDTSPTPGANVAALTDEPLLSGYVSDERLAHAPGSAALVATAYGRGQVILFMDNPNFRAFWYGTNRLFLNAVFLGHAF